MKIKTISRSKHKISEEQISQNALKVLRVLHNAGFDAYLVGGCVRDLLLGRMPKDFDIVTDALPNQIKKLFRNCRLIGRRFRLAHVYFGREIIEVATFRAGDIHTAHKTKDGLVMRDNVYGTIDQDVDRRDFTVNALFYDVFSHKILDFVNGFEDLCAKKLDIIGRPSLRYREDPVRILRAVRIAGKLGFTLTSRTAQPIKRLNRLLKNIVPARIFDEVVKTFHCGAAQAIYPLLIRFDLLEKILPLTAHNIKLPRAKVDAFIKKLLRDTDMRIQQNKVVAPAFLFAALLWYALMPVWEKLVKQDVPNSVAFDKAISEVLRVQRQHLAIPHRISLVMREIWRLQRKLELLNPRSIWYVFEHRRFRAAYDLLLLRSKVEKKLRGMVDWWEQFQVASREKRDEMVLALDYEGVI
ncbi:MAG: polynucleotide adenylyltransferase PcnB [Gammaproteobacteria bacterium]